jgi:hypothetical protein
MPSPEAVLEALRRGWLLGSLDSAPAAARKIVNDLLDEEGAESALGPGSLRRHQASGE